MSIANDGAETRYQCVFKRLKSLRTNVYGQQPLAHSVFLMKQTFKKICISTYMARFWRLLRMALSWTYSHDTSQPT
jgi:hypothetical protein